MSANDPQGVLYALVSALLGGIGGALLNNLFTRKKTRAEVEKLKLDSEKLRLEIDKMISASVNYQLSSTPEHIVYNTSGREIGFDFKGYEDFIWGKIDGKDVPISKKGEGTSSFDNGILNIQRTNTDGRYAVELHSYMYDGTEKRVIPKNDLIEGQRQIRVSFEAKIVVGSHKLKFVFRHPKTYEWFAYGEKRIIEETWVPFSLYFLVPSREDSHLRIDDMEVSQAPSSIQIRNLILAEKPT